MRVHIIHVSGRPFKAYADSDWQEALKEYERLRDMDDGVCYSLTDMPIENEGTKGTL